MALLDYNQDDSGMSYDVTQKEWDEFLGGYKHDRKGWLQVYPVYKMANGIDVDTKSFEPTFTHEKT